MSKLRSQEGKTADSIVQFPPLTIRRFTLLLSTNNRKQVNHQNNNYLLIVLLLFTPKITSPNH